MASYIQTEEIDELDYLDETDYEVIEFIKNLEKQNTLTKPDPTQYRVATHTTTCYMGNKAHPDSELFLDISGIVKLITRKVIEDNYLNPVENPIFQGIVTDHLNIRFDDDMYRKKKYKPNSVCVSEVVKAEDGSERIVLNEYFNEKDHEMTRARLEELLSKDDSHNIQKNGRQKRENKKKSDLNDYHKKNIVSVYNIDDVEQKQKKVIQEIQVIDETHKEENGDEKSVKSNAEKKEYEHMYNSCSIIIKPTKDIKAVNISLFSNAQMTISGCKHHYDGLEAARALLTAFKENQHVIKGIKRLDKDAPTESARRKNKIVFPVPNEEYIRDVEILKYNITLINANYNTNYNIDLKELNQILVENEEELFVVYDPEKHRGVQINYFWNKRNDVAVAAETRDSHLAQDGVCRCARACSAKKVRKKSYSSFEIRNMSNNYDTCTKVKICIFKSGSVGLIGGTDPKHTEDAYKFVNHLLDKYYAKIVKVSLDEYLKDKKEKKNEALIEVIKNCDEQLGLGIEAQAQTQTKPKKKKVVKKKISLVGDNLSTV